MAGFGNSSARRSATQEVTAVRRESHAGGMGRVVVGKVNRGNLLDARYATLCRCYARGARSLLARCRSFSAAATRRMRPCHTAARFAMARESRGVHAMLEA